MNMGDLKRETRAGYYKLEPTTGELLYGPTRVESKGYVLTAKRPITDKATDGWRWYESREAACRALYYSDPPEVVRPCADCPLTANAEGVSNGIPTPEVR